MERGSIYPSWRYHPDGSAVLCHDAKQDAELGDAWSDRDVRWQPRNGVPVLADDEHPEGEPVEVPKRKPGRPRKDA